MLRAVVNFAAADPDIDVKGNPAARLTVKSAATVAQREIPTVAQFCVLIDSAQAQMKGTSQRRSSAGPATRTVPR